MKMAEAIAQKQNAGVWSKSEQRPWDYRREKREQRE
jgi:endonuclease YncB( thermonuclease family)